MLSFQKPMFIRIVVIIFIAITEGKLNDRQKRQMPLCSNGIDHAVAACLQPQKQCNLNLVCETATGYCCPRSTQSWPQCPNGLGAIAACINGNGCNLGLKCTVINGSGYCCSVCPNNATSSGICNSSVPCSQPGTQCSIFKSNPGLCCPANATTNVISKVPTTTSNVLTTTSKVPTTTLTVPSQSWPLCPNGLGAIAACINGNGCNLGLKCTVINGSGYCCSVCPNNATSSGICNSSLPCSQPGTQCSIFKSNTGLCCPVKTTTSATLKVPTTTLTVPSQRWPLCPNGLGAIAACINGNGCNLGLKCTVINGSGYCCTVCPNNATSSGICNSSLPCSQPSTQCSIFKSYPGLCCPAKATTSATLKMSTTTSKMPTTTSKVSATTSKVPTTTSKLPTTTSEVPTTPSKVSATTSMVPSTTSKVPTTTSKVPTTTSKVPTTTSTRVKWDRAFFVH